ncbi:uncharacterized protein LOC125383233 [Haliotis rufescens]|uniref:uncharacterized protein LOC125383233 n=1 Tax=Haliotis rufescens TaxID=6454 RepID=UPI00201F4754|nr:uncharacterized protein LOC125383233 [Haliotis rufescens]
MLITRTYIAGDFFWVNIQSNMSSTQSNIPKQPSKGSGDHDKPPESGAVSQVSLNLASTSHDDDHVGPKVRSTNRGTSQGVSSAGKLDQLPKGYRIPRKRRINHRIEHDISDWSSSSESSSSDSSTDSDECDVVDSYHPPGTFSGPGADDYIEPSQKRGRFSNVCINKLDKPHSENGPATVARSAEPVDEYVPFSITQAESDPWSLPSHLSNHLNTQFSTFKKDNVLNENILDDHPIPDEHCFTAPQLDGYLDGLFEAQDRSFEKKPDFSLQFIQKRMLNVMGPLSHLWGNLDKIRRREASPDLSFMNFLTL